MKDLELNKVAAAILIAGILAMVIGNIADILYRPNKEFKRGYQLEVSETTQVSQHQETAQPEQVDIALLMSKAAADLGQKDFKKCSICHTTERNGPNRVGPNLWDVVNRQKASKPGFTYSQAMTDKKGTWTYEDLFALITSPKQFVPGTKMAFAGYKKHEDAANVIAYLRTLSDKPEPLPKK